MKVTLQRPIEQRVSIAGMLQPELGVNVVAAEIREDVTEARSTALDQAIGVAREAVQVSRDELEPFIGSLSQ